VSEEENKALVRRWLDAMDRGDLEAVDDLIAPDYVDHSPPIPGLPPGKEGIRAANLLLAAAFTDVVHTVEEQIASGDKVMTRVITRGTFSGEFLGVPPTGKEVEITGIAVHRVAGGQLVEHWAQVDMAGFMHQIGAAPPLPDLAPPHPAG